MTIRNYMLGLAASIAMGVSGAANAFSIVAGDIKISFDAFTAGTVGYSVNESFTESGFACQDSVTDCNAAALLSAPNAWDDNEDSWGIFSISNISSVKNNETFWVKGDGDYLIGMFWGLEDFTVFRQYEAGIVDTTTAFSQGGSLAVYSSTLDYDQTPTPSGRLTQSTYTNIPGAGDNLWLSADFVAGGFSVAGATYRAQFELEGSTPVGSGSGFLNVTGGTFADNIVKGGYLGGTADLFLAAEFNDVNGLAAENGWSATADGSVKAEFIPTPGTLALMGLALVGLGFSRRLRRS